MAQIYEGSVITLAATSSDGPNGGLFSQIPAYDAYSKAEDLFELTGDIQLQGIQYRAKRLLHRIPVPTSKELPLLTRGWTFQERLLSPRVIHFGKYELIWECLANLDCECHAHCSLCIDGASRNCDGFMYPGHNWLNRKVDFDMLLSQILTLLANAGADM